MHDKPPSTDLIRQARQNLEDDLYRASKAPGGTMWKFTRRDVQTLLDAYAAIEAQARAQGLMLEAFAQVTSPPDKPQPEATPNA